MTSGTKKPSIENTKHLTHSLKYSTYGYNLVEGVYVFEQYGHVQNHEQVRLLAAIIPEAWNSSATR